MRLYHVYMLLALSGLIICLIVALGYGNYVVAAALSDLRPTIEELARRTAPAAEKADGTQASTRSPPLASPCASDQRLQRIEDALQEISAAIGSAPYLPSPVPRAVVEPVPLAPPLPPRPNPGRPLSGPADELGLPAQTISAELRAEANLILQDYAERARAEVQAQQAAGLLDAEAMEQIKRDTRQGAADELESRLPAEVFESLFPLQEAN